MRFFGLLLVCVAALGGAASAQTSARHGAAVQIPTVLRLKLGSDGDSVRTSLPIVVRVDDGEYEITPGHSELLVFSNVPWQLSVAYRPASERDAEAQLRWRDAGRDWSRLSASESIVARGDSTGGWQQRTIEYDLDGAVPADGVYRGTITYVLSQP